MTTTLSSAPSPTIRTSRPRDPSDPRRPPPPRSARRRHPNGTRGDPRGTRTRDDELLPLPAVQERGVGSRRRARPGRGTRRDAEHSDRGSWTFLPMSRSFRCEHSRSGWPSFPATTRYRPSAPKRSPPPKASTLLCASGQETMDHASATQWKRSDRITERSNADPSAPTRR